MAESLLNGLETVQVAEADVEEREQTLTTELEETISEPNASERLVNIPENQQKVLQAELQRVTGVVQPVHRLPIELLVVIFEETVEISELDPVMAMKLSHVCRSWRAIALDTPQFWRQITLIPFEGSDAFLTEIVPRMGLIPVTLHIDEITRDRLYLFQKWHLSMIPNLEELILSSLPGGPTMHTICSALFDAPYIPLKKLTIFPTKNAGDLLYSTPNGLFPSLLKLTIEGSLASIRFDIASSPTISTLMLEWVNNINMHEVLQFLQLEVLKLSHVTFDEPIGQDGLTAPRLRRLHLLDAPLFHEAWAANLKFPRLTSLYHGYDSTALFIAFVVSHPTIKELECDIAADELAPYAVAFPTLTSLYLAPPFGIFINWRKAGMLQAPFPSLRVLILEESITSAEFEEVVCRRCLPLNHPRSLLEPPMLPVEELRIVVESDEWPEAPWTEHELARSALMKVIQDIEEYDRLCVVYRW